MRGRWAVLLGPPFFPPFHHSNPVSVLSPFSYYGGKGKLASAYSTPHYPLVIEPFAGSASYSFQHWDTHTDRQVWINDLDPRTYSLWTFLTSGEPAIPFIEQIPETVIQGQRISELFPSDKFPEGFIELMRSFANVGTQGAKSVHDVITKFGEAKWSSIKRNLLDVVPRVKGWKVTNLHYQDLPDIEATWFIDPPYANDAGDRYRQGSSAIDFQHLGQWCLSRQGQVIVCENQGAAWLGFDDKGNNLFQPLTTKRLGITSDYQKSMVGEVVYERSPYDLDDLFA